MLFKHLEILKSLEETDLKNLLDTSFKYYSSQKKINIDENILNSKNLQGGFSGLIRFYRSINSNKKIEDNQLNQIIKELFNGKSPDLINLLLSHINTILGIQKKSINFVEINLNEKTYNNEENSNEYIAKREFLLNNILEFKNFSWRINISISNNNFNRILFPEIIFIFTFEDGKSYTFLIDIKIFQELRRLLTIHIKKIMENEQIALLKI
jgi:hypothetical protein